MIPLSLTNIEIINRIDLEKFLIDYPSLTRQELAQMYGIHRDTLRAHMIANSINIARKTLLPHDIVVIFRTLGVPKTCLQYLRV